MTLPDTIHVAGVELRRSAIGFEGKLGAWDLLVSQDFGGGWRVAASFEGRDREHYFTAYTPNPRTTIEEARLDAEAFAKAVGVTS